MALMMLLRCLRHHGMVADSRVKAGIDLDGTTNGHRGSVIAPSADRRQLHRPGHPGERDRSRRKDQQRRCADGKRVDKGIAGSRLFDGKGGRISSGSWPRIASQAKLMAAVVVVRLTGCVGGRSLVA
ncbi:hypothetical protein FXF51_26445 [Nonomuraea sp. PA05]|uniref:hypothetical protein n=1 Tax=Nonomuraea sp. PA05 TaxID=2604466 RepID=UPI0011D74F7F|nr:hypothetical protein [Nonomuraea sp. PA05]TYB62252.1 hypothetical protein FXF51_26445 [Nonomuraea sp. PA05]